MDDSEVLEVIRSAGGSVRYGWSGWLGGVRGLRHDQVRKLAESGALEASVESVIRRTARSRGLPSTITTYKISSPEVEVGARSKVKLEREIEAVMSAPAVPPVGSIVSPMGSDVRYRIVEVHDRGCRVEAIDDEVHVSEGRAPRKLHYSEKRFSLAVDRRTGMLFDDCWRGWRVIESR